MVLIPGEGLLRFVGGAIEVSADDEDVRIMGGVDD